MNDFEKVYDYLKKNDDSFIDKMMIQVVQTRDDFIISEVNKAVMNMNVGVYVDEKRLKKWLEMCASLENINTEVAVDLALRSKLQRLETENLKLNHKINDLQFELDERKQIMERRGWYL